jgi:hypothetical protein
MKEMVLKSWNLSSFRVKNGIEGGICPLKMGKMVLGSGRLSPSWRKLEPVPLMREMVLKRWNLSSFWVKNDIEGGICLLKMGEMILGSVKQSTSCS